MTWWYGIWYQHWFNYKSLRSMEWKENSTNAHTNFAQSLWLAPIYIHCFPVYLGHFYFIYMPLLLVHLDYILYFNKSRAYLRCLSVLCLPISTRFLFYKWYILKISFRLYSVFTQRRTKRFVVKHLVVFWLFCSCCINVSPSTDSHSAYGPFKIAEKKTCCFLLQISRILCCYWGFWVH